jgi:hypothetical protein
MKDLRSQSLSVLRFCLGCWSGWRVKPSRFRGSFRTRCTPLLPGLMSSRVRFYYSSHRHNYHRDTSCLLFPNHVHSLRRFSVRRCHFET